MKLFTELKVSCFVLTAICLFACEHDNSKICWWIFTQFEKWIDTGQQTQCWKIEADVPAARW